jgi:hypothetical protein
MNNPTTTTIFQNNTDCIQSASHFSNTEYFNICTGDMANIPHTSFEQLVGVTFWLMMVVFIVLALKITYNEFRNK